MSLKGEEGEKAFKSATYRKKSPPRLEINSKVSALLEKHFANNALARTPHD